MITVRAALGLDYTSAAWAYDERRKSPPRWFKILGFTEEGGWVELSSRLFEKSDKAMPPNNEFSPMQVRL